MKIDSSYIGMESARNYTSVKSVSTRLTYGRVLAQGSDQMGFGQLLNTDVKEKENENEKAKKETTPETAAALLQERFQSAARTSGVGRVTNRELSSAIDKFREQCMRYLYELLFGNRYRARQHAECGEQQSFESWMQDTNGMRGESVGAMPLNNMVLDFTSYEQEFVQTEQETTMFSTTGMVRTADGREINFNLDLEMSRSFTQYYKEQFQTASVRVCDPLVINLDANVTDLSDQKFFFDLDADGELDEISLLQGGSGFLALDKNRDGIINDGSELFGTTSGDGFADLEEYDENGNGWIDENDAIWDKLRIWCKDANGNDTLYRLADKGVGAICLQRVGTQFALNSPDTNKTNGYIRSTGVFLYEDGGVGTMQHVDVAKEFRAVG